MVDPDDTLAPRADVAAWSPEVLADCHSSLRNLHGYWNTRRGTRLMPARGDLDPIDFKAVLPLLMLIDVVPDAESAEESTWYLDHVVRTREPVLYRGTYQPLSTRTQREDVLFLPLSQDGQTVNMVMILGHIDWMKDER